MGDDVVKQILILHFKLRKWVWDVDAPHRPNNGNLPGWGYRKNIPDDYAFAANRWDWPVEDEWKEAQFGLFAREGIVRFAAQITEVVPIPNDTLKEIRGFALEKS